MGEDGEDGLLQRMFIKYSLRRRLRMAFALCIAEESLGDKLSLLPSHAVEDLRRRLLLRIIHVEAEGEPAGLHFVGQGDHLPPETA